MHKLFDLLNAHRVCIEPDTREQITGDERAVILRFREADEVEIQEIHATISISELCDVTSLAHESALLFEDYQSLDRHQLRSLAEIIACVALIPIPLSELVL
jgi:hypothetical protein